MCTAIALRGENFYFGRNMDIYYDLDFDTARVRAEDGFSFSNGYRLSRCYGILGTAVVRDGYPLFADAMNTEGLCMAGLEFPDLAYYFPYQDWHKSNISPYEFIPWILTQCTSVNEAEELLKNTVLIDRPFREDLPLTPLHWMIADAKRSLSVEPTKEGLKLYDCHANVLTNAPEYPFHAVNLRQFATLTSEYPTAPNTENAPFSSGFGAIGLPGDYSSASRFVKAAFMAKHVSIQSGETGISDLFRALTSVAVPRGAVKAKNGSFNVTVYTSCMDIKNRKYYRFPYSPIEYGAEKADF